MTVGSIMTRFWLLIYAVVFIWSVIYPKELYTWVLEVTPAIIALGVLIYTRHRFPLTALTYGLVLIHCIILMVGGHYTYADVPLFNFLSDLFHWGRNNYDKLGHFAQGFVPAIVAREIIIRNAIIVSRGWMHFFVVCTCLAISAFYELLEWWIALLSDDAAEAFLGTQGYVWDTQSDMGMALLGAMVALRTLARIHDRQLDRLDSHSSPIKK